MYLLEHAQLFYGVSEGLSIGLSRNCRVKYLISLGGGEGSWILFWPPVGRIQESLLVM